MNYYQAIEKKAEHGGGWAFMQGNRREGTRIVCGCGAGGWTDPGHATKEEAERCFYEAEQTKGVHWSRGSQAHKCAMCDEWTPDTLRPLSSLLMGRGEDVCQDHFSTMDDAERWFWDRHPFAPGIQITASW